jgi:RNA polymerase sigma-54 factor
MQQSLHILQAPLLELQTIVGRELLENPVLEDESCSTGVSLSAGEDARGGSSLDEAWSPYYEQAPRYRTADEEAEKHQFLLDSMTRPPGLEEIVLEQLSLLDLSPQETRIARAIAGNLDDTGFFGAHLEDIAFGLGVTPLQVEEVLTKLQSFLEPPGLAARGLPECLLIQLQRLGLGEGLEARLIKNHLDLLGRRRFAELAKKLGTSTETIAEAARNIGQLDPHPGNKFSSGSGEIIIPEILVESEGDSFSVRLNDEALPRLRINHTYKDLLGGERRSTREVREYLRDKLRDGRFFLRALEQRNETILAIAREIAQRQEAFLRQGPSALQPMKMSQIAEAVGVHETTVSRAVAGKYMATPQGTFELRYFFTAGYTSATGESISNESIRQAITSMVANENPAKPLSDETIVKKLAAQGLKVARRTIAKYREQLGLLPSHLRKR